jgi:hypothetical protein
LRAGARRQSASICFAIVTRYMCPAPLGDGRIGGLHNTSCHFGACARSPERLWTQCAGCNATRSQVSSVCMPSSNNSLASN